MDVKCLSLGGYFTSLFHWPRPLDLPNLLFSELGEHLSVFLGEHLVTNVGIGIGIGIHQLKEKENPPVTKQCWLMTRKETSPDVEGIVC